MFEVNSIMMWYFLVCKIISRFLLYYIVELGSIVKLMRFDGYGDFMVFFIFGYRRVRLI